ncbi:MAG: hypothetical protein F6K56_29050 [Moorea sp. SIO3G5]|nr:hypothetical protein [Moorena sp. SIO3G5]
MGSSCLPLLGGVRGGFLLPFAFCLFPVPCSLFPVPSFSQPISQQNKS